MFLSVFGPFPLGPVVFLSVLGKFLCGACYVLSLGLGHFSLGSSLF